MSALCVKLHIVMPASLVVGHCLVHGQSRLPTHRHAGAWGWALGPAFWCAVSGRQVGLGQAGMQAGGG